ncbi:MAG: ABC transporter permease subunit, partial [Chloroflexi bacterium]|nr:ABC transporter permease subunit [Chloroflexota bacterium]
LLAQPVRRSQVVLYKFLAFLVALAAILVASVVGMLVGTRAIGVGLDLGNLLLAHLQVYLLVVAVAAYASLFSVLYLNTGRALMVSGLITAGMHILNFVGPALGSFQWLQKGSFFYYFQGVPLLLEGRLHVAGLALHVGAALVVLVAAIWLFERRDIVPG